MFYEHRDGADLRAYLIATGQIIPRSEQRLRPTRAERTAPYLPIGDGRQWHWPTRYEDRDRERT